MLITERRKNQIRGVIFCYTKNRKGELFENLEAVFWIWG